MRRVPRHVRAFVLLAIGSTLGSGAGCDGSAGGDAGSDSGRDAPVLDSEGSLDSSSPDAEAGDADAGVERRPGPLASVVTDVEVLTERLCDLDGDGTLDNAIADLGPADARLYAMGAGAAMQGALDDGDLRLGHYYPWLEDAATPHDPATRLASFLAVDGDWPRDPSDDLSGEELFYAHPGSIDDCGDPLFVFPDVQIIDGQLTGAGGAMPLLLWSVLVTVQMGQIQGAFERGGSPSEGTTCVFASVQDYGRMSAGDLDMEERTFLEIILGGGAVFGLPSIPGLTPDVDLDGDGLERFVLDSEGWLVSCVDGDGTVVEGRDCWRDDRFADGVSLTLRIRTVSARFGGPLPGWRWSRSGPCGPPPPEESFWEVCPPGSPDRCDLWASEACEPSCGGAGSARCEWGCRRSTCVPEISDRWSPTSCDEVVPERAALCAGEPPAVELLGSPSSTAGLRASRTFEVGRGALTIEATVRASPDPALPPGRGWALAAFLVDDAPWLGSPDDSFGGNANRRGYSVGWQAASLTERIDHPDDVFFEGFDGTGVRTDRTGSGWVRVPVPSLWLDATNEGEVLQPLRLVIEPDLPETAESELVVLGQVYDGTTHLFLDRLFCMGAGCPVTISTGDVLEVGIAAASRDEEAARYALDLDGASLVVEARGLCP